MDASQIVHALGGRNGMARCPAHQDRNPSLSVRDGRDGRILVHCHAGCDQRDVIAELQRQGLWPEPVVDGPIRRRRVPTPPPPPSTTVYRHTDDAPLPTQRACEIWRRSVPLSSDAAARYLTRRGIPGPYPETLAFARLTHPDTGETGVPTLIVARHCPVVGMVRGIQRIFLTEAGGKYQRGTVKMGLGSIDDGRAELIFAYPLVEVLIAEGVETALSAHRLLKIPAWAMCGCFRATIPLPASVQRVTIVADNDAHGVSEKRARALAASIREGGRHCTILMPDAVGTDANDILVGA